MVTESIFVKKNFLKKEINAKANTVEGISFVVPVYCELYSGNLTRLINFLENQKEIDKKIQVIFVINNSKFIARDMSSPARKENQETIKWLYEKSKTTSLILKVIDLSTDGFTKNMGKIRQKGVDLLLKETKNKDHWIVLHLDADTVFSAGALNEVLRVYEDYEDLESVFFIRDFELRNLPSLELLKSHPAFRLKRALLEFFNMRTGLFYGVATYQISSRLSTLEKIGGFKSMPFDEDTQLTFDLCRESSWILLESVLVKTEDRTREEGFASKKRKLSLEKRNILFLIKAFIRDSLLKRVEIKNVKEEFFLHHSLFHLLAMQLWYKVKSKKLSFLEARDQLKNRMDMVLDRKLEIESDPFCGYSADQILALNDDVKLKFEGDSIQLCPVAHFFPRTILKETFTPGSDLFNIVKKFMSEIELNFFYKSLNEYKKEYDELLFKRLDLLKQYIKNEQVSESRDPFLLYVYKNTPTFKGKKLMEYVNEFPEWLSEYEKTKIIKERDIVQTITKTIIWSLKQTKNQSKLESFLQNLLLDNVQDMYRFHDLKRAE